MKWTSSDVLVNLTYFSYHLNWCHWVQVPPFHSPHFPFYSEFNFLFDQIGGIFPVFKTPSFLLVSFRFSGIMMMEYWHHCTGHIRQMVVYFSCLSWMELFLWGDCVLSLNFEFSSFPGCSCLTVQGMVPRSEWFPRQLNGTSSCLCSVQCASTSCLCNAASGPIYPPYLPTFPRSPYTSH